MRWQPSSSLILNRRDIFGLGTAAIFSTALSKAAEAQASAEQQASKDTRTSQTITAEGSDIRMRVDESQENGAYVVRLVFVRKGLVLFRAQTSVGNKAQTSCRMTQIAEDGHGFTYKLEVDAFQKSTEPNAPPVVKFRVLVRQPTGESYEFTGTPNRSRTPSDSEKVPALDKVMPKDVRDQLTPFTTPLGEKLIPYERKSGGQFTPRKSEPAHVWQGRGCRMMCWGVAGVGSALCCAGTAGVGCLIAAFGFGAAASLCSDGCPS